jgi:hypothetical protein
VYIQILSKHFRQWFSKHFPTCNDMGEIVFTMSSTPSNNRNWVLCVQLLGYASVLTITLCSLCDPCRGYVTRAVSCRTAETVKYGRESQGTRTKEGLRGQGPAAYTKDRPFLSSERAPHKNKTVTVTQVIKIWS